MSDYEINRFAARGQSGVYAIVRLFVTATAAGETGLAVGDVTHERQLNDGAWAVYVPESWTELGDGYYRTELPTLDSSFQSYLVRATKADSTPIYGTVVWDGALFRGTFDSVLGDFSGGTLPAEIVPEKGMFMTVVDGNGKNRSVFFSSVSGQDVTFSEVITSLSAASQIEIERGDALTFDSLNQSKLYTDKGQPVIDQVVDFVVDETDQSATTTVIDIAPVTGSLPADLRRGALILSSGTFAKARVQISDYVATVDGRYRVTLAGALAGAPSAGDTGFVV